MGNRDRAVIRALDAKVKRLGGEIDGARAIVERIMTQHWDLAACLCWICEEGRALGYGPKDKHLAHKHPDERRGVVVQALEEAS